MDVKAAALDPQTTRAALRVYKKLIKGESAGKRAAAELQASLRSAAAQKAEIDADLNVTRTEVIIRLRPLYTAMQRVAQTNDFAAFQTAKEQYAQSFALEKAKHQAKKVKAQNRINAIDNDVKNKISEAETTVKAQPSATTVGNGLNTAAAAETEGRVTAVGSAVQDEAQGQVDASTVGENSDILNSEGIGNEQEPGEGARNVDKIAEGDTKFIYKHNPMDNPKAAKDIVEDPNAVYGYSPNPESDRIGKYSDYDWTDRKQVELVKARREVYHIKNANIKNLVDAMRRQGASIEEIARAVNELRNQNRLNDYINDPVGLEKVKQSNLKVYGNKNGLTAEDAYKKYGSWENVIERSMGSNPGMDACCGLYDKYY